MRKKKENIRGIEGESRGWLKENLKSSEFQRLYAREDFVESFLERMEAEMKRLSVSQADLAKRMNCKLSSVIGMFRRTEELTAAAMVDMAFHLNLQIRAVFDEKKTLQSSGRPQFIEDAKTARMPPPPRDLIAPAGERRCQGQRRAPGG